MLFFWTPDDLKPRGGVKQVYRHAEILQRAGIEARVLHTQPGFVSEWFEHRAPMAYVGASISRRARDRAGALVPRFRPAPDLNLFEGRKISVADRPGKYTDYTLSSRDVVVVPEYFGAALAGADIDLPMVIFSQNVHGTFRGCGFGERPAATAYTRPNVLGAIVVSEHNRRYLEYAFPSLEVRRVVNGVDAALFHPNDAPRLRQIAYMPRKMPRHLEQVINILAVRGALDGWRLLPIAGMSESKVAEALRHSTVYLSTCKEEGFGLPPVEAGMAGCLVVGYTGSAADEYFQEDLCERLDQDDVLGFAQAVERLLRWVDAHEVEAMERSRSFSAYLSEHYSLTREADSVLTAWRALLAPLSGS